MLKSEIEELELIEAARDAVAALPHVHVENLSRQTQPTSARYHADAVMDVTVHGQNVQLVIESRREIFPRDAQQAIWQLRDYLTGLPPHPSRLAMVIGQSVSKGARTILQEAEVAYFDLGGSLFIPTAGIYILVERPAHKKVSRAQGSIFQGQKARVVQALIDLWPDWVNVKALAEGIEVSPATASETLTEMARRDWLEVEGAGPSKQRRIRDRGLILDEWARSTADQKPPHIERYYVSASDSGELARRLDSACREVGADYAITAEAAGQAYAPYLSSISQLKCRVEPGRPLERVLSHLDAHQVNEGWNLGIIETRARGDVMVGERIDGIAYAPPVQVYFDLLQSSGRAKEMASHLRSERLTP